MILEALGRWLDAERAYTDALVIDPGFTEARDNLRALQNDLDKGVHRQKPIQQQEVFGEHIPWYQTWLMAVTHPSVATYERSPPTRRPPSVVPTCGCLSPRSPGG